MFHPSKPGKVHILFDCSAKYRGSSLNKKLLQGPDLTNSLVEVLTRFRQEAVAFMADVEAMFHQAKVVPKDCNALRFLWWPNSNLAAQPGELMMAVHSTFSPEAVHTVKHNFYVDDCLKSVATDESAICLSKELRELLSKGGFCFTKWLSNSRRVVESIPEAERAAAVKNLDFEHPIIQRALRVQWQVGSDTLASA